METASPFRYETRLNILQGPLEVIDEKALADACQYKWYNQTICKVNDSVVRLALSSQQDRVNPVLRVSIMYEQAWLSYMKEVLASNDPTRMS